MKRTIKPEEMFNLVPVDEAVAGGYLRMTLPYLIHSHQTTAAAIEAKWMRSVCSDFLGCDCVITSDGEGSDKGYELWRHKSELK